MSKSEPPNRSAPPNASPASHHLPDGARVAPGARPSLLAEAQLHITNEEAASGAPGIGFGE